MAPSAANREGANSLQAAPSVVCERGHDGLVAGLHQRFEPDSRC